MHDLTQFDNDGTGQFIRERSASRALTIFDLSNVAHNDLGHGDLDDLALADDCELLLLLDAALEATELLLLAPVVEGRHEHHDNHRDEDGRALDPAGLRLALVVHATRCFAAS